MNKDLILREKLALQRTVLANQATLLAFLRTALYFLVAGLSIRNFLDLSYSLWVEVPFYSFSGLIFLFGIFNFFRHRRLIRRSERHIGHYQDEYLQK